MKVNARDIQFLTGYSRSESIMIVSDALGRSPKKVKETTSVDVCDITKKLVSVYVEMDGKNPVQNSIDLISAHGISVSMKKEILTDLNCMFRGGPLW